MVEVVYRIIEHDGGYAYKVGDTVSETFSNRHEAMDAARRAAAEQQVPGETASIEYQDNRGVGHRETARGDDRPTAKVED